MFRKIAIVGSKSLLGCDAAYSIIDQIISLELQESGGNLTLINGGEDGVDTMAGEVAYSRNIEYEVIPLEECPKNCIPGKKYCFEHSYKPRSKEIASQAQKIYRIYDEGCGQSTCEVTARYGEEFGKPVERHSIDMLTITSR